MKALLQRVKEASVGVADKTVASISNGLLVFLGIDKFDSPVSADKLANKTVRYRIFSDEKGHMNKNVLDTRGDILVVSQFTLSANTQKGLRPSFSDAAKPEDAMKYYNQYITHLKQFDINVQTGIFAADMQVKLINDGPVTFLLSI